LSLHIDITVMEPRWSDVLPELETGFEKARVAILEALNVPDQGELSVALMNDLGIQALNKAYRGKDKATNVLSFPVIKPREGAGIPQDQNEHPALLLGDIVLAYETILREADDKSVSFLAHCLHLFVHGFLHLLGYDHDTDAKAESMEALEIDLLEGLGIDNPYEINRP